MADIFTPEKRSEIMSLIRSKNTKPELLFFKILSTAFHKKGYRYRKHYNSLPGKPDAVFVSKKIALFVDGNFWHGYKFDAATTRLSEGFWQEKIIRNMARDKKVNRALKKEGWTVMRFWEHEVKKTPEKVARKIEKKLTVAD
jgi:DNA mismatch endonuclease (patch repair protein)